MNKVNIKHLVLANTCLVFVAVLVTVLAMEVFLRLMKPQIFNPHPPGMYTADPYMGYALTPGFDGWFIRSEFQKRVRVDKSGLRRHDPRPRQPNTVRILCLGDSFTWGWGTNDQEAWPYQLELMLQSRYPALDVQVLNGGVSGYGTDEELEFLKARGTALDPDLVIIQFFSGNDFEDNRVPARETVEIRGGMLYRPFRKHMQPRPVWLRVNYWVKRRSHLATLISERLGYLAMRVGVLRRLERVSSEYFTEEDGRRTIDLLVQIARTAERLGARSLFLLVPEKMQVFSGTYYPSRATTVMKAAAMQTRVPWIDLTPTLMQRADRFELYYTNDAHWTPAGHQVIAGILYQQIIDVGLDILKK